MQKLIGLCKLWAQVVKLCDEHEQQCIYVDGQKRANMTCTHSADTHAQTLIYSKYLLTIIMYSCALCMPYVVKQTLL